MSDLRTTVSVAIEAPADRVWDALTTPRMIKRWFFGVDTETDWAEGSSIVHRGEYQGRPYEDKGTIVRVAPGRQLVYTHWSPVSGLPDEPPNYQEVTWELSTRNGTTELTVSETNLPSEESAIVSERAWRSALDALRALLER